MDAWPKIEHDFVRYLCERYDISSSQIQIGFEDADIVLWASPEALQQGLAPWMIFELKSTLPPTGFLQNVLRHTAYVALRTGARYVGVVTPDIEIYYSLEPVKTGWRLEQHPHFPRWEGLRDKNSAVRFQSFGKRPPASHSRLYSVRQHRNILITNAQILSSCYKLLYAREHWARDLNLEELCKVLLMRAAWARDNGRKLTIEEFRHWKNALGTGSEPDKALQKLYHDAVRHFPEELDSASSPKISLRSFESALLYMRSLPSEPENALSDFLDTSFQDMEPDDPYSTPNAIIQFSIHFLEPRPGQTVCDLLCGKGGFLYNAARYVSESRAAEDAPLNLLGVDYNDAAVRVTRTRFAFRKENMETVTIRASDPLRDSFPPCDIVFVNARPLEHARGTYELELSKLTPRGSVLFLEYALGMLKEGGRMGILLPEDVLVRQDSVYQRVRKFVEHRGEVQLVCRLPDVARIFLVFLRKRKRSEPPTEAPILVAFFSDGYANLPFDKFKSAYDDYLATGRGSRDDDFSLYPVAIKGSPVWFSPPSRIESEYPMTPLFMLVRRPKMRKLSGQSSYHALGVQNGEIVVNPKLTIVTEPTSARVAEPGHIAIVSMGSALGKTLVVQKPDTPDVPRSQQIAGCLESRNVQLLEVISLDVEPEYVAAILNLDKFRYLAIGASVPHINFSRFLHERIPVPPKDVQEDVIRHTQDARRNAENLRAQAEQCLKQADAIQREAQKEILDLF